MKKRLLSFLIIFALILPVFAVEVSAADFGGNSSKAYSAGLSFEEYMVSEITDYNNKIDVSAYVKKNGWDVDDVSEKLEYLVYNYPELFFIDTSFEMQYTKTYSHFNISFEFLFTKKQYSSAKKKFDKAVKAALATVDDSMTDMQKALTIHDYLIVNTTYSTSDTQYSAYGCLVDKKAVCQGYALAYSYLLRELGIESSVIYSKDMNHAWNYIKLGKKYYHVDVTFDDPMFTISGKNYDGLGKVSHTYFLLSDAAIKKAPKKHYNWKLYSGLKKATDKTYDNYFWRNVDSQIFSIGSYLYYLELDKTSPGMQKKPTSSTIYTLFKRYSVKTGVAKTLTKIKSTWNSWGKSSFYQASYARLSYYDGLFYLNTYKRVYSVDKNGKNLKTVCKPSVSSGYIYGMTVTNEGKLRIAIAQGPNAKPSIKAKWLT